MAKELYLYSGIYSFTALDLVKGLNDAGDEDVTLRINSPGGDVMAGWGIIAKMQERKGKTNVKVDGAAMSMGVMPVVFADYVECLDVSTFMIHRAAMYGTLDEDQQNFLNKVNKDLRSKLESKIDTDELLEMKGVSIANLFEDEKRIDLFLSAKEAKKLGLVDRINKLTPQIEAEISAFSNRFNIAATAAPTITKQTTMTKAELKAAHPGVYAEIFGEGEIAGSTKMKEIAEAWAHFASVDAKAASEGIKSGVAMTQLQMIELTQKQFAPAALAKLEADSEVKPLATSTPLAGAEKEKEEVKNWLNEVKAETQTFKIA